MVPPLLAMPAELVVRISSNLTTIELGLFRRSCKQIEQYLFHSFAKEFFSKRQFMLEYESLDALLGIASHPGISPYLQEVIFSDHGLLRDETVTQWERADTSIQALVQHRDLHGIPGRVVLQRSGKAHSMLCEIFSKLPNLRTVGLRDYEGRGRRRDGEQARWRPWGWSLCSEYAKHEIHAIHWLFPLILNALAASGAKPSNIEVFLRQNPHLSYESFLVWSDTKVQRLLRDLKTLMLSFGLYRSFLTNEVAYKQLNSLKRFLSCLSCVEHLRLNFGPGEHPADGILAWLSGKSSPHDSKLLPEHRISLPRFPNLTRLDIGMARMSVEMIVGVVIHFNLQKLSLWKIVLNTKDPRDQNENAWRRMLLTLSEQLPGSNQLREIYIGYAAQMLDDPTLDRERFIDKDPVEWVPRGTDPEHISKATREHIIKYQAQYVHESAKEWLLQTSELAYVLRPTAQSVTSDSEEDDDEDRVGDETDPEWYNGEDEDDNFSDGSLGAALATVP